VWRGPFRAASAGLKAPRYIDLKTAVEFRDSRVLRDGVIVLDRDRAARLRFEVQSRNEYFDLEPIRRAYRAPRPTTTRP
jgi:hypothetical protein